MIFIDRETHSTDVVYSFISERGLRERYVDGRAYNSASYNAYQITDHGALGLTKPRTTFTVELGKYSVIGHYVIPADAWDVGKFLFEHSMPALIDWYRKHKVKTPFVDWLRENPAMWDGHDRTAMGVFRTTDHDVLYVYVQNGKLYESIIAESSFIREGKITTLATAVTACRQDAAKKLLALEDKLAEIEKKNYNRTDTIFDSIVPGYVGR